MKFTFKVDYIYCDNVYHDRVTGDFFMLTPGALEGYELYRSADSLLLYKSNDLCADAEFVEWYADLEQARKALQVNPLEFVLPPCWTEVLSQVNAINEMFPEFCDYFQKNMESNLLVDPAGDSACDFVPSEIMAESFSQYLFDLLSNPKCDKELLHSMFKFVEEKFFDQNYFTPDYAGFGQAILSILMSDANGFEHARIITRALKIMGARSKKQFIGWSQMLKNDRLTNVMRFAINAHASVNHRRKYTDEPYHVHPERVAKILARVTDDEAMIATAWLHDVLEDVAPINPEYDADAIRREFGNDVLSLVLEVTDVSRPEDGNRKQRKAIDREHLKLASPRGKTIKLADLIDNCKDIQKHDPGFAKVFKSEVRLDLPMLKEGDHRLYRKLDILLHGGMLRWLWAKIRS